MTISKENESGVQNTFGCMNTAETLDKTFYLYKKNFIKHLLMTFILYIISLAASLGIVAIGYFKMMPSMQSNSINALILGLSGFVGTAALAIFLSVFFNTLVSAANTIVIKYSFHNESVTYRTVLSELIRSIPRILLLMLAQAIVIIPVAILIYIVFYLLIGGSVFVSVLLSGSVDSVAALGIGAIISIIIGVIFIAFGHFTVYVLLSLCVPSVIYEKKVFFGAISRSFQLVCGKRSFWKLFSINLIWGMITAIFSYSITILVSLVIQIPEAASGMITYSFIYMGIQMIVSSLIGIAIVPLNGILQAVLYTNQRIKKDGFDMERALIKLAVKQESANEQRI